KEILTAQQEELTLARQEIDALKGEAAKSAEEILANDPESPLAKVVREWRPRVARVECRWDGLFGEETNKGSGLWLSSINTIITSDHVVVMEGVRLGPPAKVDSCSVKLPGGETVTVRTDDISSWKGIEGVSAISIKEPPASFKRVVSSLNSVCKSAAPSGESVVILGYPSIGAENDVTVTEGIIAGHEDDFYITSAKIDKGSSGGAAVLISRNCYLGIPTFVRAGEVESLGRILDSRILLK
ncbi:MAG: trypsin-like peptidase domain-containing protein, partial [Candidatus Colwellbacteria bacterium]